MGSDPWDPGPTRECQTTAGWSFCHAHASSVHFSPKAITHQLDQSKSPVSYVQILLSELSPAKLALFNPHIATFVQTSCPRLSIDWGYAFDKPLLSPYEMAVAVGKLPSWMDKAAQDRKDEKTGIYPMDFYAANSPWAISRIKGTFDV